MDKGLLQFPKVFNFLFLILLIQIASHGSNGKKHVHLRIYVPDIIKHHIHTKVVFLHVDKPAPKKPKTHHKEYHHENWSSWSYGNHHDNDHHNNDEENNAKHFQDHEDQSERERLAMLEPQDHGDHNIIPHSYYPQSYVDDNHLQQNPRNREHGQYEVREEVNDTPQNEKTLVYNYEEGYRKGLQSESGHIRTGQSSKFHDDQHEENDDDDNGGYKEDSEGRTEAGRYFVDDVDYENTRDKRDGRRRYRLFRRL